MKALITGASSGIGKEIAKKLDKLGFELILVAKTEIKLLETKKELNNNVQTIVLDLSKEENCYKLYEQVKKDNIDILINNAGFGIYGEFINIDLSKELNMLNTNIKTVHILTKLFLQDFYKKNKGYILNTASTAAFFSGPLMSSYYATKSYILHLTEGINEELKQNKSKVYIGILCPGPVNTEFNKKAKIKFGVKAMEPEEVATYAIKKMFQRKTIIIPGFKNKILVIFGKLIPRNIMKKINYKIQKRKEL